MLKYIFPFFLLLSCAAKRFVGPDGNTHYQTQCDDEVIGCYEKAGDQCPTGYSIINESSNQVPRQSDFQRHMAAAASANQTGTHININTGSDTRTRFTVIFDCKTAH